MQLRRDGPRVVSQDRINPFSSISHLDAAYWKLEGTWPPWPLVPQRSRKGAHLLHAEHAWTGKLPATITPEQQAFAFGFERDQSKRQRIEGYALTRPETDRDIVYRDLALKGYIVGSACRYGGDFVIYEDHPSKCHSCDTVRVRLSVNFARLKVQYVLGHQS